MPDLNTRFHKLAEDCVAASYLSTDINAKAALLVVATELLHIVSHGEGADTKYPILERPAGTVTAAIQ